MYTDILQLTHNLMTQNQHSLCSLILQIIFKILSEIRCKKEKQQQSILHNLIQGWLDILLTKNTPKPDSYINQYRL